MSKCCRLFRHQAFRAQGFVLKGVLESKEGSGLCRINGRMEKKMETTIMK